MLGSARGRWCNPTGLLTRVAKRLCSLLPRGSDSPRTWERHAWGSSRYVRASEGTEGYLLAATRWSASPLRGRGLSHPRLWARVVRNQGRKEIYVWILSGECSRSFLG